MLHQYTYIIDVTDESLSCNIVEQTTYGHIIISHLIQFILYQNRRQKFHIIKKVHNILQKNRNYNQWHNQEYKYDHLSYHDQEYKSTREQSRNKAGDGIQQQRERHINSNQKLAQNGVHSYFIIYVTSISDHDAKYNWLWQHSISCIQKILQPVKSK